MNLPNNFFQDALRWRGSNPADHPVRFKAHTVPWKVRKGIAEQTTEFEAALRISAYTYYASFLSEAEVHSFMKQAEQDIRRMVGMFRGVLEADAARMEAARSATVITKRERAQRSKRKRSEWVEELEELP